MTVGQATYDMVYKMLIDAVISSAAGPDVDNYVKTLDPDPGLITAIDNEISKIEAGVDPESKTAGGGGEFENALAELVDGDWIPYADASMSDEEYTNYMENDIQKPPMLEPMGERQGAGIVNSALSGAKNPMSIIAPLMATLPHAALVLLAASLAPMIVEEMKKPGSMLDVRWRRIMQDEFNAIMSRQDQWNAQIGVRQVYVQSHDQFLIMNGAAMSESNLRQVRESDQRIADRIEFTDHAKEFFR